VITQSLSARWSQNTHISSDGFQGEGRASGNTALAEWNFIGSTDKRLIVLLASSLLYRGGKPGLE
jgi:hypothetical protein